MIAIALLAVIGWLTTPIDTTTAESPNIESFIEDLKDGHVDGQVGHPAHRCFVTVNLAANPESAAVKCAKSYVRVVVQCGPYVVYGPKVSAGYRSSASCPIADPRLDWAGYITYH